MNNGWTGGQYSIYRVTVGAYLLIQFGAGVDVATPMRVLGSTAAVFFALGLFDRIAAAVMLFGLALLFRENPLIANPSLLIGCVLLAHLFVPPAPFGSWTARKRVDPRGGWTMRRPLFAAAWTVLSLGYAYSGYTKLVGPAWANAATMMWVAVALELLYVPLALFRRGRPWIWTAMLVVHLALIVLADLSFAMVILHFFTFDPAWIRGRDAEATETIFYDGTCGLCHRSVRFVLAEDLRGTAFRFSPLGSELFLAEIGDRPDLPDSVIVLTGDRKVLVKSEAFIRILVRLGGLWRVIGTLFALIPRGLRDVGYDFVARIRYRIFGRAKDACPLLPPDLRARFL